MAGVGMPADDADLTAAARRHRRAPSRRPSGDPDAPLQAIVTNLDASDYLGRLAIGRVVHGTLRRGEPVALLPRSDEGQAAAEAPPHPAAWRFAGIGRVEVDELVAGDLFVVAGFPEVEIGDTIADPADPEPLPRLIVDEPVLRMTFGVNTSPLAGKDGKFLTSPPPARAPRPRGARQRVDPARPRPTSPDVIEVAGRGELQLAVLIESMRREGYELQVSRPEVIIREIDGKRHEPLERAVIDVPDEHVGTVTQALAPRKGRVTDLRPGDAGPHHRHLRGARPRASSASARCCSPPPAAPRCCTSTTPAGCRGRATCPHRTGGAMIADRAGRRHRLRARQPAAARRAVRRPRRGRSTRAWSSARTPARDDMVVNVRAREGEDQHPHPQPRRGRQARAAPSSHTLETAIEWIADDELVEVTPEAIRIRKRYLGETDRRLSRKGAERAYRQTFRPHQAQDGRAGRSGERPDDADGLRVLAPLEGVHRARGGLSKRRSRPVARVAARRPQRALSSATSVPRTPGANACRRGRHRSERRQCRHPRHGGAAPSRRPRRPRGRASLEEEIRRLVPLPKMPSRLLTRKLRTFKNP